MKNISNLTQPEVDPFDAPVPGQSLTDEPGNYPWEHPPQHNDPEEVLDLLFDKLGEPEVVEQVIAMLDSGVPVEAIVRVMTFSGFMNGKFNPDVGFLIIQPLMNMVSAIGIRAGIKKLKLSIFFSELTLEDKISKSFIDILFCVKGLTINLSLKSEACISSIQPPK